MLWQDIGIWHQQIQQQCQCGRRQEDKSQIVSWFDGANHHYQQGYHPANQRKCTVETETDTDRGDGVLIQYKSMQQQGACAEAKGWYFPGQKRTFIQFEYADTDPDGGDQITDNRNVTPEQMIIPELC